MSKQKTKNEELEQLWEEFKDDDTVKISQFQLALIFERGEYYCRKQTEEETELGKLSLSDLKALEVELSDLVEGSKCSNGELDTEGVVYNSKLMLVHGAIERKVNLYCDSVK